MENPQRSPYNGFMGTPAAKITGLVVAFAICFFMAYLGWLLDQCLMALVGILLFIIPKLFGVKDFKTLLVFGFAFLLITPTIGAFGFTIPYMQSHTQSDIDGDFSNVSVVEVGDTYTVSVTYTGSETGDVNLFMPTVGTTSFKRILMPSTSDPYTMTWVSGNTYTYTGLELTSGKIYGIYFECGEDSSPKEICDANITNSDITNHCVIWNFYAATLGCSIFFLILLLTTWMRSRLEKTRAKMEAEGRLYPQGYGRCKECGMVVLPGETVCRKCGAYIEVPEEIKAKMKHKVEFTVCSECGAEVPSDAHRCPKCGASFDEEEEQIVVSAEEAARIEDGAAAKTAGSENEYFECSECGARVPANADKCPKCGAKFDED